MGEDSTELGANPAAAVFISYASQDAGAARRICEALRVAGIEVWFDKSELRGGEAWDAAIRNQIKSCALFIPVISINTHERVEGYFRLEWKLAIDRSHLLAPDQLFLLPVVIDRSDKADPRIPERFRELHWTDLSAGEVTADFRQRVTHILLNRQQGSAAAVAQLPKRAAAAKKPRRLAVAASLMAAAVIIAAGYLAIARFAAPGGLRVQAVVPEPRQAISMKSIAVLPFENLTGHADDAYLADGLQEEILNALARLRELTVISRTSVMVFRHSADSAREIGRRLGVGSVLEGSIRRDANTLRLTIQLIDANDDRHVLAANYDRDLTKILGLQSAVARQVADALAATLSQYERGELDRVGTNSGDAYNRYLRAVALFRRSVPSDDSGLVEPIRLLEEAVHLDPDYADALALLSQAHTWNFQVNSQAADASRAKQAFQRSLEIDPDLAEARLARGLYEMYVGGDSEQALTDLDAVVRLRPSAAAAHAALGFALRRRSRFDEALEHQVRASNLDPFNEVYSTGPITTLMALRRYPEAIEQTKLLLTRLPDEPDGYLAPAAIEWQMKHDVEPLRALLREHSQVFDPNMRKAIEAAIARTEGRYMDAARLWQGIPGDDQLNRKLFIGSLYLKAGNRRGAEQAFRAVEHDAGAQAQRAPLGPDQLQPLALAQSMLGDHAAALATIERVRAMNPETRDAVNGPYASLLRSFILVRGGRAAEGYAEGDRLLHVPFGLPIDFIVDPEPVRPLLESDPRFKAMLKDPPRL
ncbi:MAG TPA: TIR domain-containing protein [Steroidobacteraceae bacterium]|jgi:TolB-like protein